MDQSSEQWRHTLTQPLDLREGCVIFKFVILQRMRRIITDLVIVAF